MLKGRTVYVISPGRRRGDGTKSPMVENRFRVTSVRQWLPAGPTRRDGNRRDDLVQFIAYKGGVRTVRVKDIIDIR